MAALSAAIDTDGTGDYTSMQAAETAEAQDLTDGGGDTWTGTCEASSGTADTTAASISGFVTASGQDVTFDAKAGDEAVKTGIDTARFRLAPATVDALRIFDDYVNLTGLQIRGAGNGVTFETNATGASVITRCYIDSSSSGSVGIAVGDAIDVTVLASVVAGDFYDGVQVNSGTLAMDNCVVWGATSDGIEFNGTTTGTIRNCIVDGGSDDFDIAGTATVTISFSMSGDGDGGDAVAINGGNINNELTAAATGNMTLVTTGNAYHGGTNASGAVTDMDGDSYHATTPSLGVDEYVAAGGAATATPEVISRAAEIPTMTPKAGATASLAVISRAAAVPAMTVTAAVMPPLSAVSRVASVPGMTPKAGATVGIGVVSKDAEVPLVSAQAGAQLHDAGGLLWLPGYWMLKNRRKKEGKK